MFTRHLLWLPLLAMMGSVQADNAELKAKLQQALPDIEFDSVTQLADTGLYETVINGEVLYFTADARYVFQGEVIEINTGENLTENKKVAMREGLLAELNEDDMIIYEPQTVAHTLTIFTDIDCGYCRKLHQQMAEYNALGIRIRYMAYPRSGIDSDSFNKAEAVWCADDRKQAMNNAKQGNDVASATCDSPVKAQFELGRTLGVTGTPSLFLDNGQMLPGYVPPKRLKQLLDDYAAQS